MIQRFSIGMDGSMEPDEAGQWVRYEDAVRVQAPTICGECRGEGEVDTGIGAMDCNVCCGSGIVHQTPLFTASPADVPMLTPEEIDAALHVALPSLSYDSEDAFITGVRVGEKLVRQKADLP